MSDPVESVIGAVFAYGCFFVLGATAGWISATSPATDKDVRQLDHHIVETSRLCEVRGEGFVTFQLSGASSWTYSVKTKQFQENPASGGPCGPTAVPLPAARRSKPEVTNLVETGRWDEATADVKGFAWSPIASGACQRL